MWRELPPELCRAILHHLSLVQLRLLKTLSRATANHCRAVLRSEAWQSVPANFHALEQELKTQLQSWKLPLTVSCFPRHFPKEAPCLATIHRLKMVRLDPFGYLDTTARAWEVRDSGEYRHYRTIITDMCIEVHGYGICGSETTLRQVLQQAIRDRGVCTGRYTHGWSTQVLRTQLWPFEVEADPDDPDGGVWQLASAGGGEVPLNDVLESLKFAVEVRKGIWAAVDPPPSLQADFDDWGRANPLHLCQLGSKLFV